MYIFMGGDGHIRNVGIKYLREYTDVPQGSGIVYKRSHIDHTESTHSSAVITLKGRIVVKRRHTITHRSVKRRVKFDILGNY